MMLEAVGQMLAERVGLDPAILGEKALACAVSRSQGNMTDVAYLHDLASDEATFDALVEQVVTPETWFFRDEAPFEYLAEALRNAGLSAPRILCAPCASGEEAVSIAITLRRNNLRGEVVACDISEKLLRSARSGVYPESSFRSWRPQPELFSQHEDGWRVDAAVTSAIEWRRLNLLHPEFQLTASFDCIFCRNLLIYLTAEARETLLRRLDSILRTGGVLFLGHAETVEPYLTGYERIDYPFAFAWRKP